MVMKSLRDGASGGISKFILFGFLVAATGGLVLMDVGGFFRGGVASSDVARIGDKTISIRQFDSTVRRSLSQIGLSPQKAYKFGYINQLLSTEIRDRLINQAAHNQNILIGQKYLAEQISKMVEPYVTEDRSKKEVLMQLLRAQGMDERSFVKSIQREAENNILIKAINAGFADLSPAIVKDLYRFQNEKRNIEYIIFPDNEIDTVKPPSKEKLREFYNLAKENYAIEESRKAQIIIIKDDAIKKTIDVTEEDVRAEYEANIDAYKTENSWILEQALLKTEEEAQKIYEKASKDIPLKQTVESVTGKTTAYLGEKKFQQDTLLDEFKDKIDTNVQNGTILEPVQSPIGWYVVKVKSFESAHTRPFEDVKDDLRNDILETLVIDRKYDLANAVDDMFAGGASLEEVKQEVDLEIIDLPAMNIQGMDKQGQDTLADFPENRALIIETIVSLLEGETSPVIETQDGTLMAVHLQKIAPKSYKPFEDVRSSLETRWISDQKRIANRAQVDGYLKTLETKEDNVPLTALASETGKSIQNLKDIKRNVELKAPLLTRTIGNIFQAKENEPLIVGTDNGFAIVNVTNINLPEDVDTTSQSYKDFKKILRKGFKNEAMPIYIQALNKEVGATINNRLLEQVYGPESAQY